jgi:hypothetical protein
MNETSKVIEFIDETLTDMTTRPAFWGPLPAVELQVLRLLEVRLLLVDSHADSRDAADVARAYWDSLARDFPGEEVSLRTRVKGDTDAFARWLAGFCTEQQRSQDQRASQRRIASLRSVPQPSLPPPRPYTIATVPASDHPVTRGESRLPR